MTQILTCFVPFWSLSAVRQAGGVDYSVPCAQLQIPEGQYESAVGLREGTSLRVHGKKGTFEASQVWHHL
jgi:hypothetical protein